ncbi:MAG: hypothetical protein SOW36_08145 [Porphyromonas sp.]|uniref:plasmid mobilization protein n=1 Tax=Porphyromonas sp. TaxID=1924944 RepID=UPI002A7543E0|nr:hypothetical protein [Porphyromonas sp.]MDY3112591.1 hypothetical protein [Porphyromonas sp.]
MNKEEKIKNLPSKWNRWDVRLTNPEDQIRVIESFKRSGCDTKSDFVRKMILREDFHVVKANGDLIKFTTKLTDFIFAVNKIGVLYNQAVRAMNKYHSEEKAEQLLNNVSNQQMELMDKLLEVIELTKELKDDCQSEVP